MKKIVSNSWVLLILSGFLLIPAWYEWGTGLVLLIAFIPLLIVFDKSFEKKAKAGTVFLQASLTFLVWNLGDTWWIRNALVDGKPSYAGVSAAILVSTLFMSIPIWLAYLARKRFGRDVGFFALVVFWLAYEFSYLHGEVSWPWLTLGNGFMYNVKLMQWYSFTGAMGGSMWLLVANILIYKTFFSEKGEYKIQPKNGWKAAAVVFIPIIISFVLFYTYKETENPRKVIVVQPNVDPYLKFNDVPPLEQTKIQVDLARELADSTVDYVVAPETSVMNNIWIGEFDRVPDFKLIRSFQKQFPGLKYITGIMCYQMYPKDSPVPPTAKEYRNGFYFDSYNSSIQIDSTPEIQLYHKSKLVIGVEKMPYPGILKILEPIMLKLGGTFRSHNTQPEREAFSAPNNSVRVGTPICYESVYGEFVGEFVQEGANLLFVITNDGWWGNTPGYRQHNAISSIRAIETRRSIARSANTGISSFINQRGEVLQSLGWWKRGALIDTLNANDKLTFYVKHGDYIGRIAFFAGIFIVLSLIVARLKREKS
ncbi:MAG: apolipoprotein N-acyltransferase [Bacteroidales bacterium]|nr:apolipoprotein N-acyltransferase [Bacteroidales bacterium]MBN2819375.1 apolipoprotein N-acyltransferase [Bacteroidales bacterium]